MAARPILGFEVAVNGAAANNVCDSYNKLKNTNPTNDAVEEALIQNIKKNWSEFVGDHTSLPEILNPPTINQLQLDAINHGYTARGEMFSALAMTVIADKHQAGRYKAWLVERDLLNDPTPSTSKYDNARNARDDSFQSDQTSMDKHHERLTVRPNDPLWSVDIVQLLIRGHLIAVW
jgi:hypothetical protein